MQPPPWAPTWKIFRFSPERSLLIKRRQGKTRQQIDGFSGGKYVGGRITKHQKLKLWIEENPVLGRRLRRLLDANAKRIKCAPRRLIAAPAIMKNNGMDAYGAVQAACRHVWEDIRTDISADMLLA